MDIESIISKARDDVETVLRDAVSALPEAAQVVQDVKTLDVSALMADLEDVIHGHLTAAGIEDVAADVAHVAGRPAGAPGGPPLPADVAAGLSAETSAEPADVAVAAGSMGEEVPAADPPGVTRAQSGQQ